MKPFTQKAVHISVTIVVVVGIFISFILSVAPGEVEKPDVHKATEHVCIHDQIIAARPSSPKMSLQHFEKEHDSDGNLIVASVGNRDLIRIKIETAQLYSDPGKTCFPGESTVTIGTGGSACRTDGVADNNCNYDCTGKIFTTEKRDYLINTILADTKTFFEQFLKVNRLANMTLSASSVGTSSACPWATMPTSYSTTGVSGIDFVILVAARPTFGSTIAWASDCEVDSTTGRPILGFINFGPQNIDTTASKKGYVTGVAIHEVTHSLGFSGAKYLTGGAPTEFRDPTNSYSKLPYDDVVANITRYNPISNKEYAIYSIKTPTVRSKVRAHFGCNTLAGGDLEDGGGSGTKNTHWEKRIFMNEYMTGTADHDPVFSDITWALLEDTGWYTPLYDKAEGLTWGRSAGCPFVTGNCANWGAPYSCSSGTTFSCNANHKDKSGCTIQTHGSPIIDIYRHFTNEYTGGQSVYSDYCPYYIGYNTGDCTDSTISSIADFGEERGANGRCMVSTLVKKGAAVKHNSNAEIECHLTGCATSSLLKVKVGDFYYDCPASDPQKKISVVGFSGQMTCPRYNLCGASVAIDNNWPLVTSMSPTSGGAKGGLKITLQGEKFTAGSKIYADDALCTQINILSANNATAVLPPVPSHTTAGPAMITIKDLQGRTASYWSFTMSAYQLTLGQILDGFLIFLNDYSVPLVVGSFALLCSFSVYKEWQFLSKGPQTSLVEDYQF